jgi:hypothetical protein
MKLNTVNRYSYLYTVKLKLNCARLRHLIQLTAEGCQLQSEITLFEKPLDKWHFSHFNHRQSWYVYLIGLCRTDEGLS